MEGGQSILVINDFRVLHPTHVARAQRYNIYVFKRGLRSETGMNVSDMSPSRASSAAESSSEFPLMPTWPGTQAKTVSLSYPQNKAKM